MIGHFLSITLYLTAQVNQETLRQQTGIVITIIMVWYYYYDYRILSDIIYTA